METELLRWRCPDCAEECVASERAWIDHARSSHHCPPTTEQVKAARRITMALQGWYDG